jgi:hypothetical protein
LLVSFHAEAARQSARRQHFGQPEPDPNPRAIECAVSAECMSIVRFLNTCFSLFMA